MSLRMKILSGFLILAIMLAGAGVLAIYELHAIGSSVHRLLQDNYRSIDAAQIMSDALEEEDAGILLLIAGKWQEGRAKIDAGDRAFRQALKVAQSNLTVADENRYVARIGAEYANYKASWANVPAAAQEKQTLDWYFKDVHRASKAVNQSVKELIALNDEAMYTTASNLYDRANRAAMPGIVAILSALVFVLVFNYFVHYYVIRPITLLMREVQDNVKTGKPIDIHIETKDELQKLVAAVKELAMTRHRAL